MKLIQLASILILSSPVAVAISEAYDRASIAISEVVGTWRSARSILSIHPDGRFELNGGPKIEYGIWEESSDVGFYLRYRARNKGETGLSRAGHFVIDQGDIAFYHDDEVERFEKVEGAEQIEPGAILALEASEKHDASGPDTAEMASAFALTTASLQGAVDSPGDYKLIKMALVWRKGTYAWESTYKLRGLLPENPGEEIVGAGGEIFITINLKTQEAEIRYGE